ncbi:MAG: precorrin-6A/cobalt-precorrin-6A reductase [Leptolyngbya sp. SIO1D8]|nr:precorrin-6A/cobalt-precorrin-6A reductase [Leptolyngbya sp. SIO1D8]
MTGRRLWLVGGTQESRWLVQAISASVATTTPAALFHWPLVSVTTETARQLYPQETGCLVWVGRLTPEQGDAFITSHNIGAILDASHPFAKEISQLAIALAQRYNLPYLRYERASVSPSHEATWQDASGRSGNILLPQLTELFTENYLTRERTFLTLGYRLLSAFEPWQSQGVLFTRILPSSEALTAALAAGFIFITLHFSFQFPLTF